jgi:hypothetical protein
LQQASLQDSEEENQGHAGIIVKTTKYLTMAGVAFNNPIHPGIYPAGLTANAAARTQSREEAEHKELLVQYEILKGVEQALKDIILEAVEHDYLLEIEDDTLRFLNQTPRQMINHLKVRGGALDFADTKTLFAERDMEWDISENPQIYFNRVEKAVNTLTRANITSDMNQRQDMALYHFEASREFNAAVCEWENKPSVTKIKQVDTENKKETRQTETAERTKHHHRLGSHITFHE